MQYNTIASFRTDFVELLDESSSTFTFSTKSCMVYEHIDSFRKVSSSLFSYQINFHVIFISNTVYDLFSFVEN